MIDLGLDGARAVVLGAGFRPERAGHGRAAATFLAEAGAHVACVDVDADRAARIAAEIEGAGGSAVPIVGDIRRSEETGRVLDEAIDALGGLDVCVDIVGEALFGRSDTYSDDDWHSQLDHNLHHAFFTMRAATTRMVDQGTGGTVVCVASVDGIAASSFHAAYGAAKAGIISLTKTFSDEFGHHGIRYNAVAPGNVGFAAWDKPVVPFGGDVANSLAPPRPQDIGKAILFLASSWSERITGQTIVVDGGATTRSPWLDASKGLEQFFEAHGIES